ncbi:glycosyltransferase family 2 protein [Vibrio sp. WZ-1]|uniref:glycosyltransferase family 2 protein n=1 Tax=Vibrio sp. WZ-1 TaxID=3454501 RepID=UPI003F857334
MIEMTLLIIFGISVTLIIYHHIGYPLLLKYLSKRHVVPPTSSPLERGYMDCKADRFLPSITIIVPAYNEEKWIAEKIKNLASLDYPRNKLAIIIACDGCIDKTVEIAEQTIQEAMCADTLFIVKSFSMNRGKIAVINELVPTVTSDVTVLSDVSALISCDSLLVAADHFRNLKVGVVNASYQILNSQNQGEVKYWHYQSNIKYFESLIGSSIGSHGAFYAFRTELFSPLAANIINDDFVLPMSIVAKGKQAIYEPRMRALELEESDRDVDFKRRLRISAGNMQQLIKLHHLLMPRYRGTAFTFFSGKVLRVAVPYLMLVSFACSIALFDYWLFQYIVAAQVVIYTAFAIAHFAPQHLVSKPFKLGSYLLVGHYANFVGGLRYLLGLERHRWTRIGH